MKVLLMNPPWINNDKEYGLRAGVRWPMIRKRDRSMPFFAFPFFLAYGTSYLRSKGVEAHLHDSITLEESHADGLKYVLNNNFDLVVLETSTPSFYKDIVFCADIKKNSPQTHICFSGQHATGCPEEALRKSKADFVLIGEYEKTLLELVSSLEHKRETKNIKGLAFLDGDHFVSNGRNDLITMEELPFPYRDPQVIGRYNEPFAKSYPNLPMITSRGCSYRCKFCVEALLLYGPTNFRYTPIPKVVEEIQILKNDLSVKEIFFDDAFFTFRRAEAVAKAILEHRIQIHWSCWIDRNTPKSILELLKASGCTGVKFGVETFNEAIGLQALKKVNANSVETLVQHCNELGILTHATYVIGLPGETKETLKHTLKKAMELNTTSYQFSIATPLPGTQFFDEAREKGWLKTEDWSQYEGQNSVVLRYDDLEPSDITGAMDWVRKQKMLRLVRHPLHLSFFLWKLLKMKGFFGLVKDLWFRLHFLVKA